ncbi:unnamed protein product [Clonostachys byssicola]|uniref:GPI inositol-deacylase winged helix domain-containing protein n=1 Tax=Clonostachys byssicola TaxID=160290 RepID=A0A9N9Y0W3_9HYPO|nr:unnamed protein product [Clonostachys byssicola]
MLRDVDPIYQEDVQRALNLLCCAKRPLLVEELMLAIAVELGDSPKYNSERQLKSSEDLRQICAGFIDIDVRTHDDLTLINQVDSLSMMDITLFGTHGTRYEMVRIAHFSVQEFLKSDRIRSKDFKDLVSFHVDMQDANDQMAGTCLAFLLEPSILEAQMSESSPLALNTLRTYAARHWVDYYDDFTSSASTRAQASRLFCGAGGWFEKWLWYWDHDRNHPRKPRPGPLYYASLLGIRSVVYKLIEDGLSKELDASSNAYSRVEPFFLDEVAGNYGTALQAASMRGHLAIVQRLIEGGANINQQSGHYGTALQLAADGCHLEIVHLLVTKGADVNQQAGDDETTALQAASLRGQLGMVQFLLENGANINQGCGYYGTALQAASTGDHCDVVQFLIENGAHVNQEAGRHFGTALQAAIRFNRPEIARLLLKEGAEAIQISANELKHLCFMLMRLRSINTESSGKT